MTKKTAVTTLVDNSIYDKRLPSEFGYSLLIDYGKEIMFDRIFQTFFYRNVKVYCLKYDYNVLISHMT